MKLCYCDESGNRPDDVCFVAVGVIVDSTRLHKTNQEFDDIFKKIQSHSAEALREIKATKLFLGRDRWRQVDPVIRKKICENLCSWINERKHHIIVSAIDRNKFSENIDSAPGILTEDCWLAGMAHLALQLQKTYQHSRGNKGKSFLFIDDNKRFADKLSDILWEPPDWTDTFYNRPERKPKLTHIIDTALAVKSHHCGLVQVADLYAFVIRRYIELNDFSSAEEWSGERDYLQVLIKMLKSRMLKSSTSWTHRTQDSCTEWYKSICPLSFQRLPRF